MTSIVTSEEVLTFFAAFNDVLTAILCGVRKLSEPCTSLKLLQRSQLIAAGANSRRNLFQCRCREWSAHGLDTKP